MIWLPALGGVLIEKERTHANTPGRLRARSGSKLPSARFRSGPWEDGMPLESSFWLWARAAVPDFLRTGLPKNLFCSEILPKWKVGANFEQINMKNAKTKPQCCQK